MDQIPKCFYVNLFKRHGHKRMPLRIFHFLCQSQLQPIFTLIYYSLLVLHMLDYGLSVTARSKEDYSLSSFNSDERREATLRTRRERRAAESSQQRETRLARRRVADRARYAARTAEEREARLQLLRVTGQQIGFRDCRGKRGPSPATESHATAEIGEKIGKCNRCNSIQRLDKCYDQVTAKLELGNDTEFKVLSSFSPIIEEISGSNDATIETLLFSEPFHAEYSTTGIITKIS